MATVQLKPKAKEKPNFADLLKQTQKDTPKDKSKSSVPVLETPPEIKGLVDTLISAKKAIKVAEAEESAAKEPIKNWVEDIQHKDGFAGKFRSSYKVQGSEDTVTYISQNSYSMNVDDKAQIEEILGEEGYAELIEEKHTLTVKAAILENPEGLLEVVGDRFVEFFESETKLVAKEDFNKLVYRYVTPEKLQLLKTFVKRREASVR